MRPEQECNIQRINKKARVDGECTSISMTTQDTKTCRSPGSCTQLKGNVSSSDYSTDLLILGDILTIKQLKL